MKVRRRTRFDQPGRLNFGPSGNARGVNKQSPDDRQKDSFIIEPDDARSSKRHRSHYCLAQAVEALCAISVAGSGSVCSREYVHSVSLKGQMTSSPPVKPWLLRRRETQPIAEE